MNTSTKIALGALAISVGCAVYRGTQSKSLNEFLGIGLKKFGAEPIPDIAALGLAIVAGGTVGMATSTGHHAIPLAGGIAAAWSADKLWDLNYPVKYSKEKYSLVYAASALLGGVIASPNLKTTIRGRDRSHLLPKKWGFKNYDEPLNVSSVPTPFHDWTDRKLPSQAKNTIGLVLRVTPPLQAAGVTLLQTQTDDYEN